MNKEQTRPGSAVLEKHLTTKELAAIWGVSQTTIVRIFCDEEGVLKLAKPARPGTRTRVELRIPLSVADRVHSLRTRKL